ncbi:MAG TPA: hypothetical protein VFR23_02775 [Jiangellaceae bacterium]|nr:hypothetical protein [Jiangellaceae bacterium]
MPSHTGRCCVAESAVAGAGGELVLSAEPGDGAGPDGTGLDGTGVVTPGAV